MEVTGDWETDLSRGIVRIVDLLERIANALEDYVYDDDNDNGEEDGDPSDGPFLNQEQEEPDDYPDVDYEEPDE